MTSIVNAFDDGKSTGEIRDFFDMLGPSDIRKVQELLLPDGDPALHVKQHLFSYRYPMRVNAESVCAEIKAFGDGDTDEIATIRIEDPQLASFVRASLAAFLEGVIINELVKGRSFNFNDCALMNCIYAGTYLLCGRNLAKAAHLIEKTFGLVGSVLPASIDNKKLCALREDGTVVSCEADIVELRSNTRIEKIFLVNEQIEGQDLSMLTINQKRSYLESRNCNVDALESVRDAILSADIIIYAAGTQHSSLYPTYMTRGIADSIAYNRHASKIFVTNIGADYETPTYKASDYIRGAYYYLNVGASRPIAMSELFDMNLVNKTSPGEDDRKNYVDFDRVGFINIDVPIELDDYECGDRKGVHNGDRILEKTLSLHASKMTKLMDDRYAKRS